MNYLTEIKLFNEWLETEQLPSNAIVLWYALMFTANRCGWRDEFAVSFSVLQSRTKLDRSTVWRMRKVLTDRGIISVEERGGNRSARLSAAFVRTAVCVATYDADCNAIRHDPARSVARCDAVCNRA